MKTQTEAPALIMLLRDIGDQSNDDPNFIITKGTFVNFVSDEEHYWICEFERMSFPILKSEGVYCDRSS